MIARKRSTEVYGLDHSKIINRGGNHRVARPGRSNDDCPPPPTGPHSRLAWHGVYSSGRYTQPLRFCLTALKNPQPSLEVTSIDLYSGKSITAACIMAMTPGKSGLMQ